VCGGGRARCAALGGVATAFGLAVGLEALPFHALIGASYAIRLAAPLPANTESCGRNAGFCGPNAEFCAYFAALCGAFAGFYGVQTPPWRWGLSVCDAAGLNLVAAITAASAGL